jgi:CheY-like chemotaxis protein
MMGGTIGLSSQPGKGSCFWLHLPLEMVKEASAVPAVQKLPASMQGKSVLVVDDNLKARRNYSSMLENLGLRVDSLASGEAAIAEIQTRDIALLLLDWKMPTPDGVQTTHRIRQLAQGKSLPILLMAGSGCDEQLEKLPDLCIQACLTKPLKPDALYQAVQTALQGSAGSNDELSISDDAPLPAELAGSRILLVEDNLLNQNLASELLVSLGAHVEVAQNGWEAVEAVQQRDYDAVLMDVQMPDLDGYEATRKIRQDLGSARLPVIGLTANAQESDRALAMAAGMDDFLTKPIDLQELVYTLTRVIAGSAEAAPHDRVVDLKTGKALSRRE